MYSYTLIKAYIKRENNYYNKIILFFDYRVIHNLRHSHIFTYKINDPIFAYKIIKYIIKSTLFVLILSVQIRL